MAEQLDGGIVSLKFEARGLQEGREDLWDEYCGLCKKVKELVRQKKRKEVVEKVNVDVGE